MGYNKYSKGSKNALSGNEWTLQVLARLDSRIKNYEYSRIYILKISGSFENQVKMPYVYIYPPKKLNALLRP